MENSFQSSFIPKKIITSNNFTHSGQPKSLLSIISTFLFIVSILASAGLFAYKIYLDKQKESLSVSLSANRQNFDKSTIDELELFDKRTQFAKQLLNKHLVFSPMFSLLEQITVSSIQYIEFNQKTDDTGFVVEIKGLARDYRSIAIQADIFNNIEGGYFKNVLFSNLVKDKNNNINFDLKFNIEPDLLSYEKNNLLEKTLMYSSQLDGNNPLPENFNNETQ